MAGQEDLILRLRATTDKLERDLARAKAKMTGFQGSMNKIGASLRSTMLAAFAGQAILQGIGAVLRNLSEFELQMARVKAISGATDKEFKALTANALELGRTTSYTAGEISTLQLELSKLGFSTKEILKTTKAIQELALVTGEELGESAKTMAGTLRSFNLEADQSGRAANVMAESFSKSSLTLEKFTVGTANSGAIANAMGVTLEQNTARLGALTDANIDASKAGTDLRKIYIDLNEKGISYGGALEMVKQSSNKVATATELVGIRAAGALVILSEQQEKVNKLALEYSNTNREMSGMAATIEDTLAISFDKLTSALDGTIKKGGIFNEWMKNATDLATEFVQRQSESIGETGIRKALEEGTALWKAYTQDVGTATSYLEFHEGELKRLKGELTSYTLKLRLNNEKLNENNKSYRDIIEPLTKLQTAMDLAKKVVDAHTEALAVETAEIEAQAAALKLATQELAKYNAIKYAGAQSDAIKGAGWKTKEAPRIGVNESPDISISSTDIDNSISKVKKLTAAYQKQLEILKNVKGEYINIADGIKGVISASLTSAFESLGNMIAGGGDSTASAMEKIGMILADGMKSIGAAMIAMGVAKALFDKALFSNPYVAIAAGGALVAAGAALATSIGNANSSMSSSGGGGARRGGGGFAYEKSGTSMTLNGNFKVSGTDLVLVLGNQANSDSRNRG